jgi:hypothetical protein
MRFFKHFSMETRMDIALDQMEGFAAANGVV